MTSHWDLASVDWRILEKVYQLLPPEKLTARDARDPGSDSK